MEIIKKYTVSFIVMIYMILSAFLPQGDNLSIEMGGLLLVLLGWLWIQLITKHITLSFHIKNYSTDVKIICALFVFSLIKLINNTFGNKTYNEASNVCVFLLLLVLLFIFVSKKNSSEYIDGIIYAGVVIMGTMLFAHVGNEGEVAWLIQLVSDKTFVASCALFVASISVISYCLNESKTMSIVYLSSSILSFLVLCINSYCISFWILLFVFLLIPIIYRPTAELIKKDMQLLFLCFFMLSNMSLISNYTDLLLIEVNLSLESSVYLEMFLALGALVFFHYWDRLPEEVELKRISMIKLQRVYVWSLCLLCFVFVGIVFGANSWKELPDTMSGKIVKSVALPAVSEIAKYRSGVSVMIENVGLVGCTLLLGVFVILIRKLFINYHMDKIRTNVCVLTISVFFVQFLLFDVPLNLVLIYYFFILYGAFMNEEKIDVRIIKEFNVEELKNEIE